jgi:hypothetical protein
MLINPGILPNIYWYVPKVTEVIPSVHVLPCWCEYTSVTIPMPTSYCHNSGDPRLSNTQHRKPSSSCLHFHPSHLLRRFFRRLHLPAAGVVSATEYIYVG